MSKFVKSKIDGMKGKRELVALLRKRAERVETREDGLKWDFTHNRYRKDVKRGLTEKNDYILSLVGPTRAKVVVLFETGTGEVHWDARTLELLKGESL